VTGGTWDCLRDVRNAFGILIENRKGGNLLDKRETLAEFYSGLLGF
jgi:hypothetical protein